VLISDCGKRGREWQNGDVWNRGQWQWERYDIYYLEYVISMHGNL
jgi:hypothetical protein